MPKRIDRSGRWKVDASRRPMMVVDEDGNPMLAEYDSEDRYADDEIREVLELSAAAPALRDACMEASSFLCGISPVIPGRNRTMDVLVAVLERLRAKTVPSMPFSAAEAPDPERARSARRRTEIDAANEVPAGTYRIFLPTVARYRGGAFHLMNKPEDGWRFFAYAYPSLEAMRKEWAIRFTGEGCDEHGSFVVVEPEPRETAR